MNALLTGGIGYIASHTAIVLLQLGPDVIVCDNLSNSHETVLQKLQQITHRRISFVSGDVCGTELLKKTLINYKIDAVVHFAGLKAVGESVVKSLDCYGNNVQGAMQ